MSRDWWVKMLMPNEGVVQPVEYQGSEWLGDMFLCGLEDRRYYHEPKFRTKPQRYADMRFVPTPPESPIKSLWVARGKPLAKLASMPPRFFVVHD